tara:strand:+ start:7532 stop:11032 length:3501 start_codon:yes stop_codon:yes gene_type:complete
MITAGTIDTSFVIGSGFTNGFDDCLIYTTKLQSDGKILVGGNFTSYDGNTAYHLIRLNPDGSVDNTFDYGPYLTHNGSGDPAYVKAIEIESDGKILVGGYFDTYNGIPTGYIIRLNTDGSVSDYFTSGFSDIVRAIKVQPDGKILVGGSFGGYNSDPVNYIARLNTNGSLDTTFGTGIGNGFNDSVFSIEVENNGKILVGGNFDNYNGINTNYIARLDQTGSIFNTFNSGFNNRVQKIVLQPDGKILCGGQFDEYNGIQSRYMIRLNPNCTINTKFDFNDYVIDMCVQPDGRIVVVGKFNEVIDTVYGQTFNPEYIIRLNPSGSVDNSFYPVTLSGGFNNDVNSVMLESNGNILVGGWFTDYLGEQYNRLISLNNDELTYTYQYVYEVGICSNNQNIVYYVGSNVELSPEIYVTISDINNPSFVGCGFVDTFNLAQTPTYEYVITNNNCNECLSANSQIALVQSCANPEITGPILVSNQYQIGDILYINETFIGEGSFTIRGCFTIVDVVPYDSEFGFFNNIINYQPQQSCESCIACNGQYYVVEDCNTPEPTTYLILSNQLLNFGDVIYYQSGETPCKQVIDVVIEAPSFVFDNPEIINSTLVFDNCDTCLNTWTEQIQGDGSVDFNNPIPAPFDNWGIIGPDNDSCNPGWTYVKYQVTQSGSLTLFYDFTTSTDLCCDWPFYYVSPNEPIGSTNINFSVAGSGNIFGPNYGTTPGDITINYNAGDWISIGVYSSDCVEGPGVLFISAPQIQESSPYSLHNFTTCDGPVGYVTVPSSFDSQLVNVSQISYSEITSDGLDLMLLSGDCIDDEFIKIPFPTDFSSNFLCETYDSVYMGTNSYITFGSGSGSCCFTIPNEIPTGDGTGLPGVYISTSDGVDPTVGLDTVVFNWYSGLTNSGDNFVIRYEGTYYDLLDFETCDCTDINNCPPLVYSFVFYKNEPNYFDLVIQSNTRFYNDDPTGGVSNGINTSFLGSFNSSSEKSYRITTSCPVIQGNIGSTATVCGTIGSTVSGITTPSLGGLFYSDGTITYDSCSGCTSTINYKVTLKNCKTNEITYIGMNPDTITLIQENGFIFSNGTPDCYELLDVCEITYSPVYTPIYFYTNCADCLEPLSSGNEAIICLEICGPSGNTVSHVIPPHPVWTNQYGKAIEELSMITLGGINGLNN